ncbi:DUF819 domain-containing protein [Candidatus Sulfurimonas baltica]|uniref:DUF819 domain-containing protein n=1 Tax=Candidatus Sulfurimonas baltica TaxID=2740404 RepID=A0A7S7LXH6_9BACT|nr:DUF819 family protein [Candidatus Sulfurimonas baltica]QOY52399.1 DUF819 domain-containing protein [Candidatus Sulfurimonas baltica]
MISSPLIYLFALALVATFFSLLEQKTKFRIFKFVPAVVMIYAFSMTLAGMGVFEQNEHIDEIYKNTKKNLLPAMLFLMLLQVDFRHFFKLGRSLLISYVLAVLSLAFSFVVVSLVFNFNQDMASAFGALAGSWMGGTANMIAVGSALNVSDVAFGFALIVDSVNYTIWVMFLLFLVPFASYFNNFTLSQQSTAYLAEIGCACNIGAKRYWLFVFLSIGVALFVNTIAYKFQILNYTTTTVIIATIFGILGSFTKLKNINGSSEVATTMLYILIALIGSHAIFDSFTDVGYYVFAGFMILVVHAIIMVIGAKIFKLDLFSIAIASLSNIGGVASAPILAATYNKALVSVGVLMAIMGYIIGTFGGLVVGNILIGLAK